MTFEILGYLRISWEFPEYLGISHFEKNEKSIISRYVQMISGFQLLLTATRITAPGQVEGMDRALDDKGSLGNRSFGAKRWSVRVCVCVCVHSIVYVCMCTYHHVSLYTVPCILSFFFVSMYICILYATHLYAYIYRDIYLFMHVHMYIYYIYIIYIYE